MACRQVLMAMPPTLNRRKRVYRCISSSSSMIQDLTDSELRARYRFGKDSFEYICNILEEDLKSSSTKQISLTVEQQVAIALRFYASGSFLQVIGDTLGRDKSSVSRVIDRVTNALLKQQHNFIKWPTTHESVHIKSSFYEQAQFPNVIGCIDGTHIRIQAPGTDEPAYVNRKGYHSINVQAVCDHEGKFTQITAKWPGSTHDSHVFKTSSLCNDLELNHKSISDGIILGDSGYACRAFLLTPFRNPQARHHQRFNTSHSSTRSTIERTFGIWKRRFHVLHSEIRMKPGKVCRIVGACAILHNIAIKMKEPLGEESVLDVPQQPVPVPDFTGPQDGRAVREHIAQSFF